MSTKIYHGYRIKHGADLFDVIEELKARANPVRDCLDRDTLELFKHDGDSSLFDAETRWSEYQEKTNKGTGFYDPFRLDVCFVRDPGNGDTLALLYCDRKELVEIWESLNDVEYYGYWNNTDPDEDCTELEWEQRREAWDRAIGWDPPIRRGIMFQLRSGPTDGMFDLIYKEMHAEA